MCDRCENDGNRRLAFPNIEAAPGGSNEVPTSVARLTLAD